MSGFVLAVQVVETVQEASLLEEAVQALEPEGSDSVEADCRAGVEEPSAVGHSHAHNLVGI